MLEETGFELVVPPSFSQLATQAERDDPDQLGGRARPFQGGPTVRIRFPPPASQQTFGPLKTMPVVRSGTIAFAIILALAELTAALSGATTRVSRR